LSEEFLLKNSSNTLQHFPCHALKTEIIEEKRK
jgi:hypothetical protein